MKLKAIREQKGLTVRELACKSKLAHGYISDLENGRRKNPSLGTMTKISKALEVTISEIFLES